MILRWFFSKTVRQAVDMHRHVRKILRAQSDLLSPEAVSGVEAALGRLNQDVRQDKEKPELLNQMKQLEAVAVKYLKPYPNAGLRENFEVLLVAVAVAMGVRTFFLQPFKIPTGSMQPTLFGVVDENLINEPGYKVPGGINRFIEWAKGNSYVYLKAKVSGDLEEIQEPRKFPQKFLIFNLYTKVKIGGQWHTIWFPPDMGASSLRERAKLEFNQQFQAGEDVVKLKVSSGDHLFVDRLTYNFRHPTRGEIIVFETKGVAPADGMREDQFYIKRLIGLPNDEIQIGDDHHVRVNGVRLDASNYHFENVYSFDPSKYDEGKTWGHANGTIFEKAGRRGPTRNFNTSKDVYKVRPGHFMTFGDNTINSWDSRDWGDFNRTNVIGKAFFVYWPITTRFGPAPR